MGLRNLNNIPILFKNNLIIIIAYLCMCLILMPINFLIIYYRFGLSSDATESKRIVLTAFSVAICIIISLLLCFLIGRIFFLNTQNLLTNVFSVLPLFIIIIIIILFLNEKPENYGNILTAPICMIGETILFFFNIKRKYAYWIVSIIPSVIIWFGMITKRSP